MTEKQRIILGITGSSGIIYGIRFLEELKKLNIETHLVITKAGQLTRAYETDLTLNDLKSLADVYHPINKIWASIASGSFKTLGMIVAPCSMNSLSAIATGISNNLLTRAADVVLKERRKLVLIPREAPLHLGHLESMTKITQLGGIIFPPAPAFYNKPKTIEDIVNDTVGRVLDMFNLDCALVKRWEE